MGEQHGPVAIWHEAARRFAERGLLLFGRRRYALDPDIPLEQPAGREALLGLVQAALPGQDYTRLELWLYPSGYDRAPIRWLHTRPHPREAVLRCEAWPRAAAGPEDRDEVELQVRWPPGGGPPVATAAEVRRGRLTGARLGRRETLGLRQRLDRVRERVRGAELRWQAPGGLELVLRAERALLLLGEVVHRMPEGERAAVQALCARLEAAAPPGEALVLEEPAGQPPGEWRWLPLLFGRRRTLARTLLRARCPRCATEHDGALVREAPYDATAEVAGDAGMVLHCPQGHELVRVALGER
ncbi:MAG: hypothetical protein KatS3mg102_1798 [Planctomycetota bacterium]|nr:MAG: hypothetical protein KatS3mg102_1798 [Planctomycetota bacterium]